MRCSFQRSVPPFSTASYDVYDWTNVGFVATGAEAEASGVRFDTSLKGNSNAGHTYGATLSREQRELLLEYLKTL